jgi:signal transduction histidine kinase/CheY-like chemotaxis protein
MNLFANKAKADIRKGGPVMSRGPLLRKYAAMFAAVVCVALVVNGLSDIWFSYHEQKALLVRIQRKQAESAAEKIDQFLKEIEGQLAWAIQLPWSANTLDEWRIDAVRLMHQVPAVTEISQLDAKGREQLRVSREAPDVVESEADHSTDPAFIEANQNKIYYGPVYFVHESEPYMTIAMAGTRRDYGVIIAQVNLKFIWDVVSQIKDGGDGTAYVIDSEARLIAHPDISLVLRATDMSNLPQVEAARATPRTGTMHRPLRAIDLRGREVLSAHAGVAPLGWLVFVEMPIGEAYAPLYSSITRAGILLLASLALAVLAGLLLARRMVVPIRALHDGAVKIGGGDLGQRISIKTGDELEALGDQFNDMAFRLQDSYATLERKVEERTRQLEIANHAKSRFLAAASHDLRQPLHALGLFVAQLRGRTNAAERKQLMARIDAALSAMNELFNALLDISKLDAGVLTPDISEFSIGSVLKRVETTFASTAREKQLSLRVVPSSAWVRTDFILLERIVFNLVSNAVRYTSHGRVVVGCRRYGDSIRIEVWDTGPGIPPDQQQNIFSEFYRLGDPDRDRRAGLGLGLAIVERLCNLLEHPIHLESAVGKGSCFSIDVLRVEAPAANTKPPVPMRAPLGRSGGKIIAVIDDDPLVLEGMGGLFRSWGYRVVTGGTDDAALAGLCEHENPPDLIISDYRLTDGRTGVEVIERLRNTLCANIPAFLISGDTNPRLLRECRLDGYHMLHKPVDPMALRAIVTQLLKAAAHSPGPKETSSTAG